MPRPSNPTLTTIPTDRRALLGLAAAAAASGLAGAWPVPARAAIPSGTRAPDFTLRRGEGGNLRLAEQRGRVVMVNFWATWCAPCRQEMPHLEVLHQKYRNAGFVLLGVSVDDDPKKAVAVAAQLGVTFPILLDTDKQVSRSYDLRTMPSTVLIDRDGQVRFVHRGWRDGYQVTYEQQVRELLRG
jgi:peroxiredoxin